MKPEEALYYMINHAGSVTVPKIYRDMPRHLLEALVYECDRPSPTERSEAALTAWAQQRLKQPNWLGIAEKKKNKPEAEAAPAVPVPEEPKTLLDRAIAKDGRLSTPGRRRAAFRQNFQHCRTIAEAAARTGVDTRTVRRWRKNFPGFARSLDEIVAARRRQAVENVVLAADHAETRPVFYRGKKVGEYTRRDRTLDLYLLKQADAEALRAEKRRDAAAAANAERNFEARVAAEVEQRISRMSASTGHGTMPADDEFTNVFSDFEPATHDMALAR